MKALATKQRFDVLDSFRGLCALNVFFFHLHVVGAFTELAFFRGAFLFVEFFFVLSGFVLAHGYGQKKKLTFQDFFIARTFRLFPLHIFMLILFIVLELTKLLASAYGVSFNQTPFTGNMALKEIVPNLLLLHSWTEWTHYLSFNHPSWSISVEYYMYFIFYLTLLIASKGKYISWLCLSIVFVYLKFVDSDVFTHAVISGISCFFSGAVIYYLYAYIKNELQFSKAIFSMIELLILLNIVFIVSIKVEHKALLGMILFCLAVFVFAFEKGIVSTVLKKSFFLWLGKLSYSIYMTHMLVIYLITSIFLILQKLTDLNFIPMLKGKRYFLFDNFWLENAFIALMVFVTVILSQFTYKYIELKGQLYGKKMMKAKEKSNSEKLNFNAL